MRIAISGTQFSGKSTLLEELSGKMPKYEIFEEPYFLLEEEGQEFSDPPTIEDFEVQMEYSVDLILSSPEKSLFDRCPIDFLAYALAISELTGEGFDKDLWIDKEIVHALSKIDFLIYTPIESPDRIQVPRSEDLDLRTLVDEKLRELIIDDSLGLLKDIKVIEATGSVQNRVKTVLDSLN